MQAIILGDEVGIPILKKICERIGLKYKFIGFSNKCDDLSKRKLLDDDSIEVKVDNVETFIGILQKARIDVVLVYSFDQIIQEDILKVPNVKFLNIHAGLLPQYRGANIINWVLINGEQQTGVTVHEIERTIDSGPIVDSWILPIIDQETAVSLLEKTNISIINQVPGLLELYLVGKLHPRIQDHSKAQYWKRRYPEDGIFSFEQTDDQIHNLIRALVYPWPGARFVNPNGSIRIFQNYMKRDEIKEIRAFYNMNGYL